MKADPQTIAKTIYRSFREARDKEEESVILRFVAKYIARRNLYNVLPAVYRAIEKTEKREAGIMEAEIISAHKLPKAQEDAAIKFAAKLLGLRVDKIESDFKVDKDLIGGLLIKTDDWLIDRSVNGRLKELAGKMGI